MGSRTTKSYGEKGSQLLSLFPVMMMALVWPGARRDEHDCNDDHCDDNDNNNNVALPCLALLQPQMSFAKFLSLSLSLSASSTTTSSQFPVLEFETWKRNWDLGFLLFDTFHVVM